MRKKVITIWNIGQQHISKWHSFFPSITKTKKIVIGTAKIVTATEKIATKTEELITTAEKIVTDTEENSHWNGQNSY